MMVLAPIKGSPAEQAGIQPGDEVRPGEQRQAGRLLPLVTCNPL